MSEIYSEQKYPNIRYFLGDVRDRQRIKMSLEDVDYVVHAAALKQIPAAEYNPIEYIKTNIVGAQNIIEAALEKTKVDAVAAANIFHYKDQSVYLAKKYLYDKKIQVRKPDLLSIN